MGEIVFWTLVRIAISIPIIWLLKSYIDFQLWFILATFLLYGVIIHPAIVGYRKFEERNKGITDNTLCSNCKHFDASAILCVKYDEHPTNNFIPCEGLDWEPQL